VLSVRGQPGVQLGQGLGAEVVDAPLGVDADVDEAGVAQHPQMPGDARLVHPRELDEFTDRTVVFTDVVENAPPGRFGDHLKYVQLSSGHDPEYTSVHIYVKEDMGQSEWSQ